MDEFEGLKREIERLVNMVDPKKDECQEKRVIEEEVSASRSVVVGFLEDEIDRKEEVLLNAIIRLMKIYSELDQPLDERRYLGLLQVDEMRAACLGHKVTTVNETDEQASERADLIRSFWQQKIAESSELVSEGEEVPFKPYDPSALEALKASSGEKVYRLVRRGFREVRVAVRLRVLLKPWNLEQGRESTIEGYV
ncbi:hypothetical protein CARUB_v10002015mg [Capsella rubella]|uniref:Factor of DNA methylation 1-5/IDN2 domain-containing protein n=1 Tax=Capsella rubella TaxID=81985 RepID=R0HD22_9BRAS|nr:uncharacterized protein LOC17881744 [Capsella rubella]EOA21603.1 hypothetical protein CARUB_v10002015mg [Capsella rubella]